MNTQFNSMNVVIVAVKVLKATHTKGTRLKVQLNRCEPITYGYHDFPSFSHAAIQYMKDSHQVIYNPKAANWEFIGKDTVAVALAY